MATLFPTLFPCLFPCLFVLHAAAATTAPTCHPPTSPPTLSAVSWNMAAINNNPFEYHMGQTTEDYDRFMVDVATFVTATPTHQDLVLSDLLSPGMVAQLMTEMNASPHYNRKEIEVVQSLWAQKFSKLQGIAGFLKDPSWGRKRLISFPDRVTNTIPTEGVIGPGRHTGHSDGSTHPRPTVINCYNGPAHHFESLQVWWQEWIRFMFHDVVEVANDEGTDEPRQVHPHRLIQPLSRIKYPALTMDEEMVSVSIVGGGKKREEGVGVEGGEGGVVVVVVVVVAVVVVCPLLMPVLCFRFLLLPPPQVPLQTLSLAMFDAVLVYTMHVVRPKASDWHTLRLQARNIRVCRCFTRSIILTSLSVFSRCSLGVLSVFSRCCLLQACQHLVWQKSTRAKSILEKTYGAYDVLFLQEASR